MSVLINHYLPRRVTCTVVFEAIIALLCFAVLAFYLGLISSIADRGVTAPVVFVTLACPLLVQLGFFLSGLYSRRSIYSGMNVAPRMLVATATFGLVFLPLLLAAGHHSGLDLSLLSQMCLLSTSLFVVVSAGSRLLVQRVFAGGTHAGRLLVVGNGKGLDRILAEVERALGDSISLEGILVDDPENLEGNNRDIPAGLQVLGGLDSLREMVHRRGVGTILLALPPNHPRLPLDDLIQCRLAGVEVVASATFYERVCHKLLIEQEETLATLAFGCSPMTRLRWLAKSLTDRMIALLLLAVLAVPMALVALLVRTTSPGPAIYRQQRVGRNGRTFTLLKFRTMTTDAEAGAGAVWAQPRDPRATPLGRLLRRSRFDELPQLINILRGDMAFVGPRPERPEFVGDLEKRIVPYHFRHLVKPGLTGWAQVSFGYAASVEAAHEKLRYDLYYLKNMSLVLDLFIVAATARAVIIGRGI